MLLQSWSFMRISAQLMHQGWVQNSPIWKWWLSLDGGIKGWWRPMRKEWEEKSVTVSQQWLVIIIPRFALVSRKLWTKIGLSNPVAFVCVLYLNCYFTHITRSLPEGAIPFLNSAFYPGIYSFMPESCLLLVLPSLANSMHLRTAYPPK
jgi:hypothetical protein